MMGPCLICTAINFQSPFVIKAAIGQESLGYLPWLDKQSRNTFSRDTIDSSVGRVELSKAV